MCDNIYYRRPIESKFQRFDKIDGPLNDLNNMYKDIRHVQRVSHHMTHLNNNVYKTVLAELTGNNCYLYKSFLSL